MIGEIVFIGNDYYANLFPGNFQKICNRSDFIKYFRSAEVLTYTGFVILAELRWNNFHLTDFEGLDLIFEMRLLHNVATPIILTSNYPDLFQDYLHEKLDYEYQARFNCLMDPSITFVHLSKLLEKSHYQIAQSFGNGLDKLLLEDLKANVYQVAAFTINYLNKVIAKFRLDVVDGMERRQLLSFIEEQFFLPSRNVSFLDDLAFDDYALSTSKTWFSKEDAISHLIFLKDLVEEHLTKSQIDTSDRTFPSVSCIYATSSEEKAQELRLGLTSLGINLETVSSGKELLRRIKEIPAIGVILCDYRFYDDPRSLSREQGYHIYDLLIHELLGFYEFIFLTEKDTLVLPEYVRKNNVTILTPKMLATSNYRITKLAQMILEKDLLLREQNQKLPVLGDATELYFKHRHTDDFDDVENNISAFAIRIIEAIWEGRKKNLPMVDNISGALNSKSEKRRIENFRLKLKARRVALALCQLSSSYLLYCADNADRWSVIYGILKNGEINRNADSNQVHPFINKHLLKMRILENYHWTNAFLLNLTLTQEERNWLQRFGPWIEKGKNRQE